VKSNRLPTRKLSQPIPVFNVDGTANEAGSISEVVDLIIRYDGHSERALFSVTSLGRQNMILGITWLREHNPEIDWRTGKVEMTWCLLRCCVGCRNELRTERRNSKKEEVSINACQTGPHSLNHRKRLPTKNCRSQTYPLTWKMETVYGQRDCYLKPSTSKPRPP
jgi:hypothetical protein